MDATETLAQRQKQEDEGKEMRLEANSETAQRWTEDSPLREPGRSQRVPRQRKVKGL